VLLGVWGSPIDGLINGAASSASGAVVDKYLTLWHGLNPALWMSVFVIAAGIVMVRQRGRLDAHLSTLTSPFSALRVVDRTRVGLIRLGDRVGDVTRTDSPSRHLGIIIACLVALTAVGAASIGPLPAIVGDPTRPFDWVLVALMAVGALGAMRAKTRVGAVTVIGVVGFSVTLWFFTLGAADVALTQLLVEILTVVVIVLLLQRLPATFRATTRTRRNGAVVLAGAAGVAATVAVFSLTGRRELTPAGEYFVREAKAETGGSNVVNTILVDFRALDTLGEITVLAMAGVAIMVAITTSVCLSVFCSLYFGYKTLYNHQNQISPL
jgi:multicomponent Na+:H+ antiporter subunit A